MSTRSLGVPAVDDTLDDVVLLWCSKKKMEVARLAPAFIPANQGTGPAFTYFEAVLKHASTFRPTTQPLFTPQQLRWKSVRLHLSSLHYPDQSD